MSADKLISRLPKVKKMGRLRWTACCPAHDDKHPSLAVGLNFEDLFPERQEDYSSAKERRPFYAIDVLRCISFEALLVAMVAINVANGKELSQEDRKRLMVAAGRLQAATEVANGE